MFDAIKSWLHPKPVVTCSGSLRGEVSTSRRVRIHKGLCHNVHMDVRNNGRKQVVVELLDASSTYNLKERNVVAIKILDPGESSIIRFDAIFGKGIILQCRQVKQGEMQVHYERMERNPIVFCVSFMFTR